MTDSLRARLAAVLALHQDVPGLYECTCDQSVDDFEQHRAEIVAATVRPELEVLTAERDALLESLRKAAIREREQARRINSMHRGRARFTLAWRSARRRAAGLDSDMQHYEESVVGALNERNIRDCRRAARAEAAIERVRAILDPTSWARDLDIIEALEQS